MSFCLAITVHVSYTVYEEFVLTLEMFVLLTLAIIIVYFVMNSEC